MAKRDVIFNYGADDTIVYGEIDEADSIELVIGIQDVTADDSASVAAFIEYFNTADGSDAAGGAAEGDNLFIITDAAGANVTNFVVSVDAEGVATAGLDFGMVILADNVIPVA